MTDGLPAPDSSGFDALAERFLEAVRAGDEPAVEDWAARHPRDAEQIRALFPAMLALEELKQADDARPPRLAPLPSGRLGDFRIVREIGRGGMGVVYEAVQESLGRRVAVKVLPSLGDLRRVRRFERETRTVARLHHTNIVPIFGVGEQDGWHYYVMPVIRGVGLDAVLAWLRAERDGTPVAGRPQDDPRGSELSLAQAVRALRTGAFRPASSPSSSGGGDAAELAGAALDPGELPPDPGPALDPRARYWRSVAWIGRQVASALAYAHAQGVLHRDVKPANLLLDARGVVWVTDFGLATAIEAEGLTRSGDLLGTLQYMAPEQLRGGYDARSDVYALGLTLYELLTLRSPFRETERGRLLEAVARGVPAVPAELRPGIPRDLATIVLHALQLEPRHRYRSAAALADDLQNFLDDRPIRARRATVLEHGWRWCRRNRALAGLGAVALLALVTAAATAAAGWVSTREALRRERASSQIAQRASERAERNLRRATRAFEEIFAALAGPPRLTLLAATGAADAAEEADPVDPAGAEQTETAFAWVAAGVQVSEEDAALLERLLTFYEDFAADNAGTAVLERETAMATRRVGDIQLQLGRAADAVASYRRALELLAVADDVAAREPVVAAAMRNDLARALVESGDPRAARDQLGSVLGALDGDERAAARYERARAHELLGGLVLRRPGGGVGSGRLAPAPERRRGPRGPGGPRREVQRVAEHFERAWQLNRGLVAERPEEPAFVLAASRSARLYAKVERHTRGEIAAPAARSMLAAAEADLRRLVAEHPDVPGYRAELAELLIEGPAPEPGSDYARLRDSIAEGRRIAAVLAGSAPAVLEFQRLHRRALQRAAELEMARAASARRQQVAGPRVARRLQIARELLAEALDTIDAGGSALEEHERRRLRVELLVVLTALGERDAARNLLATLRAETRDEPAWAWERRRILGELRRSAGGLLGERLADLVREVRGGGDR